MVKPFIDEQARQAEFAAQYPVGSVARQGVWFTGHAVYAAAVKPMDEFLDSADRLYGAIQNSPSKLETLRTLASIAYQHTTDSIYDTRDNIYAAYHYIQQQAEPGSQNLAKRDPLGNVKQVGTQQYQHLAATPSLERAAMLGTATGALLGDVIDPIHGKARAAGHMADTMLNREHSR